MLPSRDRSRSGSTWSDLIVSEATTECSYAPEVADVEPLDGTNPPSSPGDDARTEWVADVVLRDGQTVRMRPIDPGDADRLLRFHERQSPESVYNRFFSPRPTLNERDIEYFTSVDMVDRVAFVAVHEDEIIGVARYERYADTDTAEVAFFIDDQHNGRGLASLMLEYLAAAGRDHGLARFVATTLPANRKMLRVFSSAGYDVATHMEDGVVDIAFDIDPTSESVAAQVRRGRLAEATSVRRWLEPESVAVIGLGDHGADGAAEIITRLAGAGFDGATLPAASSDGGVSGPDIPKGTDLVVVSVPAVELLDVIERSGQAGAGAVAIMSSGSGPVDPPVSAALEAEALATARRHGVRLVGPDCFAILNSEIAPGRSLVVTTGVRTPRTGSIAVMSQSGSITTALLDLARYFGMGVSSLVSCGHWPDVGVADLLTYWTNDESSAAVLIALPSRGLTPRFVAAARDASTVKPLAMLRTMLGGHERSDSVDGVEPAPTRGAPSMTEDRISAMLRQTGIIAVDTIDQLLDIGSLVDQQGAPSGRGVAVIGDSEGAVAMTADACARAGLDLVAVEATTTAGLRLTNPMHLPAAATMEDLDLALGVVGRDPDVHSVIVLRTASGAGDAADGVRVAWDLAITAAAETHPDTVWVRSTFDATPAGRFGSGTGADEHHDASIPRFPFPEHAALALGRLAVHAEWQALVRAQGNERSRGRDLTDAEQLVAQLLSSEPSGSVAPGHADQERLLGTAGVRVVERRVAQDRDGAVAAAAEIGYPVVLKAASRDRTRRSIRGGVAIDLADADELAATWDRMADVLGAEMTPAVVQQFVERGVDVAVRVRRDDRGGGTVEVGLGGPGTMFDQWRVGLLPLTLADASALVAGSAVGRALSDPLDRVPLVTVVHRIASLVEQVDEIREIDANPILASAAGAWVADVEFVLGAPSSGEFTVRRLD